MGQQGKLHANSTRYSVVQQLQEGAVMTQSSTDASSVYDLCWSAYGGTDSIEDLISSVFRWDPPTALPTMYVQKPMSPVIEPCIATKSCKRFLGHKFKVGGSKK